MEGLVSFTLASIHRVAIRTTEQLMALVDDQFQRLLEAMMAVIDQAVIRIEPSQVASMHHLGDTALQELALLALQTMHQLCVSNPQVPLVLLRLESAPCLKVLARLKRQRGRVGELQEWLEPACGIGEILIRELMVAHRG